MSNSHDFGGNWTDEKLERVRQYLNAYVTIMSKQRFRFAYIDAFAGTGYRTLKQDENPEELMFPESKRLLGSIKLDSILSAA